jgi:hypothetical protein
LREEHRLRVFENRVLIKIFVPRRTRCQGSGEDYTTESFMTCTLLLLTKYHLGDQIKKNEMHRSCSMYRAEEGCIEGFGGRPEGKRPLERPRHK